MANLKIALMGNGGVGKDTFVKILKSNMPSKDIKQIRLADPLYEVQKFIYKKCDVEIEAQLQDGKLLNFLGQHMRFINENCLITELERKLDCDCDVLVCSDVRPADVDSVLNLGFELIKIEADVKVTDYRKKNRKDVTIGSSTHPTEVGFDAIKTKHKIVNNGTEKEYEKQILSLFEVINDSNR